MEAAVESGYKPPPEFQDDARDPLIDLNLTDSTELWLIQWPKDHSPDLDGQQVSLDLNGDGELGNFEVSPGKSYKVVSYAYQEPDATVFLSSGLESKIVGKVTRRVSLVHYPEPSEFSKHDTSKLRKMHERSSATSLTNSAHHFTTPTKSIKPKHSQSASGYRTSTHSSGRRSTLSIEKEPSKSSMRRHVDDPTMSTKQSSKRTHEPSRSMDLSGQDSGRGHSAVTSTETGEHSQEKKSKRKKQ